MDTLVNAFMKKYPAQGRVMAAYERAVGEPPAWDNITKANLHAFTEQLCREVSHNSARTYIKMFKSVLNRYSDVVELPQDYKKMLKVRVRPQCRYVFHGIDRLIIYEANSKFLRRQEAQRPEMAARFYPCGTQVFCYKPLYVHWQYFSRVKAMEHYNVQMTTMCIINHDERKESI